MNAYSRSLKSELNYQDTCLLRQLIVDDIDQLSLFEPTNLVSLHGLKYRYFIEYDHVVVRSIALPKVVYSFYLSEGYKCQ